ncbi:hypothetical protein KDAU_08490 [Dictyobacter aurantiacus]|uniref:Uncharacterized protein n=1 Tax=Dictyobacter aurantiacus TaxID=1936993 RepID=A0A401Z9G3_9CHLR|nr:hypothetical protein KDAU_08490 [Dictyobacter aurantiacus]
MGLIRCILALTYRYVKRCIVCQYRSLLVPVSLPKPAQHTLFSAQNTDKSRSELRAKVDGKLHIIELQQLYSWLLCMAYSTRKEGVLSQIVTL